MTWLLQIDGDHPALGCPPYCTGSRALSLRLDGSIRLASASLNGGDERRERPGDLWHTEDASTAMGARAGVPP